MQIILNVVTWFLGLGEGLLVFFVLTVLGLAFGVGFSKSIRGAITTAIGLIGLFLVVNLIVSALEPAVQAIATIFLLGWLIRDAGFQWTFAIGALCWAVLFGAYVVSKQSLGIILVQAFHGLAYVFFMIAGQMFVGAMAPKEIGASAQSLIFIATNGIGLFLGTQLAGFVMQKNTVGGKFQWPKIWAVPLVITLAGAIVFATAFKVPSPKDFQKEKPQAKAVAVARS